jgi:hypothetical protein
MSTACMVAVLTLLSAGRSPADDEETGSEEEVPNKKEAPPPHAEQAAQAPEPKGNAEQRATEPAPEPPPPPTKEDFDDAIDASLHESSDAPELLEAFIRKAPQTDERRAWAQLHLARALMRLKLEHAAAMILAQIARERANPEVLPEAIAALRDLSAHPHDELLIDEGVFATLDVASLPQSVGSFVVFQQGLKQLRLGRERWANKSFHRLEPKSDEAMRARFFAVMLRVKKRTDVTDKLVLDLTDLAQEPALTRDLRNDVWQSLARLRFERKEYTEALAAYENIQLGELEAGRAALYLEQAWTRYHLGELKAAMGILTTLDAPSFEGDFLPDKYLLRAFIYRDLCQYAAARRAARGVPSGFERTLAAIRERKSLVSDPLLVKAATQAGPAATSLRWLLAVRAEAARVDDASLGNALTKKLTELYALSQAEAARRFRAALEAAVEEKANALLSATEQARLMDYEIGLKLYDRGRGKNPFALPPKPEPEPSAVGVRFAFHGEYWNDELRDYRFEMKNRCAEPVLP